MLEFIFHPAKSFEGLSPITQSYGVCFDDQGRVLLMRQAGHKWNIPGGTVEPGETMIETVRREVYEETTVRIGLCEPIGYQDVFEDGVLKYYQVRYACIIDAIEEQQIDPDKGVIHERLFVEPERLMDYIEYKQYPAIFAEALKWYRSLKL